MPGRDGPGDAVDRLGELDVTVVVGEVGHVEHAVAVARARIGMLEDARVARLGDIRSAHRIRHHHVAVVEVDAVARGGVAGDGVLAVEVQEQLAGLVVPDGVGRGDVRHVVVGRPLARDDGVRRVLGPGPVEAVGVHEHDAGGGVVRREVEVPLAERIVEVRAGVEDAREDELVRRVVDHLVLVRDHPLVRELGERLGRGGRRRHGGRGEGQGQRRERGGGERGADAPGRWHAVAPSIRGHPIPPRYPRRVSDLSEQIGGIGLLMRISIR